jgi:hypothetical protein
LYFTLRRQSRAMNCYGWSKWSAKSISVMPQIEAVTHVLDCAARSVTIQWTTNVLATAAGASAYIYEDISFATDPRHYASAPMYIGTSADSKTWALTLGYEDLCDMPDIDGSFYGRAEMSVSLCTPCCVI